MSTHRVEVVRIENLERHPNADALDLVRIDGFTCAVRRGQFAVGDLAVYVEPDYVVPPTGPFAFLSGDGKPVRIKAKKLRGIYSMGLLIPAPSGSAAGDDVMERLGIVRYEPQMSVSSGGEVESPHPSLANVPKYDLESWRRYRHLLIEGETVMVTEKIHGANARFAWRDGRMWCGSRTQWKRESASSLWWQALLQNPWIEDLCHHWVDHVIFGEVFGQVQDLKYGARPGQVMFRMFDVLKPDGTWVDMADLEVLLPVRHHMVPCLYFGAYTHDAMEILALEDSKIPGANHCSEGIVIKPVRERIDPHLGRVALKLVSNRYLERS
jgi:RNA ligase (TIGR02306 family)